MRLPACSERARLKPDAPTAPIAPGSADRQDGDHPVLHDPKLEDRLRAATQADRVGREVKEIEERIGSRVGSSRGGSTAWSGYSRRGAISTAGR